MGTTTALHQLFRDLCHQTMWKYAILWKFQDESHMLLTCEDAYAIGTKSGIAMEYAPQKEFINSHPRFTPFVCESNDQSGNIPWHSIEMAVSNMTRYSYLLGEGIIGKMALMEKHKWICVGEMNFKLLLECPEELRLQVAAGIKTILLMPLLPHGVVQLGSFDELSEDLTMVAQLKDLFNAYQCTLESHSTFDMRMDQTYSRPPLEKCSTCLPINTELTDPIHSLPPARQDLPTLSFNQVMMNELLPSRSVLVPQIMVQGCRPPTENVLHQAHGRGTDILDEISWNAMCNELSRDYSEKQVMLNSSILTGQTMESDQPTFFLHEREMKMIPAISHGLASENSSMFDTSDLLQSCNDLYYLNKTHLDDDWEEFDVVINSIIDSRYLDFSIETELQNPVERSYLMSCNNSSMHADQSKADEGNEPNATFKVEVSEVIGHSIEEPCAFNGKNKAEFLALDAAAELQSVSDVKSCCSSSGRCSDSCLTQCKTDDLLGSEDSGLESRKMSSLISNSEGFTSYLAASPSRGSFHMQLENEDQQDTGSVWRSWLKDSQSSHRQVKDGDAHRPRPRDRQLIQDRIRELRELIPNASKCSIDALLERTVKHMMFLQNVPIHAEKLSQSTSPKVGDKEVNVQGNRVPQNEARWADEVRTKSKKTYPLVVENLDQQDQMLVETQCGNYGLFLEIGQAIKRMGLIILKGIFESRSEELWAHFIVEVPKGFCRMDILWPLMQLLRFKL